MDRARVAVVGYGVVGKRVADAVDVQPDMDLVGIVDVATTDLVRVAESRNYKIFAATEDAVEGYRSAGIQVAGTLDDALKLVDIVVDCSPPGITGRNVEIYKQAGVKYIVEGGEKHSLTGLSSSATANYAATLGATGARVVSCNTTSQARTQSTLHREFGVEEAFIAITRRAVDPVNTKAGPVNGVVATLPGFSHHAPDVQTVFSDLNIKSMAVVASTTLMHVHTMRIVLAQTPSVDDVLETFRRTPRFSLVSGARGLNSTAHLIEWARDRGRPRSDLWEVAIWEDSVVLDENVLYMLAGVHMESVIVPENVDCIRSMCELNATASDAIEATDTALGFGLAKASSSYALFDKQV